MSHIKQSAYCSRYLLQISLLLILSPTSNAVELVFNIQENDTTEASNISLQSGTPHNQALYVGFNIHRINLLEEEERITTQFFYLGYAPFYPLSPFIEAGVEANRLVENFIKLIIDTHVNSDEKRLRRQRNYTEPFYGTGNHNTNSKRSEGEFNYVSMDRFLKVGLRLKTGNLAFETFYSRYYLKRTSKRHKLVGVGVSIRF